MVARNTHVLYRQSTLILGLLTLNLFLEKVTKAFVLLYRRLPFLYFYIIYFFYKLNSSNTLRYRSTGKSVFGKNKICVCMYMQHQIIIFNNASSKNLFQNRKFKFNCLILLQLQFTAIFSLHVTIVIDSRS